jgi:hypothetical protein
MSRRIRAGRLVMRRGRIAGRSAQLLAILTDRAKRGIGDFGGDNDLEWRDEKKRLVRG